MQKCIGISAVLCLLVIAPLIQSNATELMAAPKIDEIKSFVVGVEDVDYFPHYAINRADKGVAFAILNLFGRQMGYRFRYQEYPIRRLRTSLIKHRSIDFSYPDHPNWSPNIKGNTTVIYSDPMEYIVSGTMVPKEFDGMAQERFKVLAVIRGFTPTQWEGRLNDVRLLEVSDAQSALKMVLLGRADGTDMDLTVANYLLREMGATGELVMSKSLAQSRFPFHLSTVNHPEIVAQFNQFLHDNAEQIEVLKRHYQTLE